jgi:branched-chain amino acid transport system substrate-binding protein
MSRLEVANSTDPDKVMAELHKVKIDDMFTSNGKIRADGLMEHEMYIMQVKKSEE